MTPFDIDCAARTIISDFDPEISVAQQLSWLLNRYPWQYQPEIEEAIWVYLKNH